MASSRIIRPRISPASSTRLLDLGEGRFRFTLDVIHPRFGRLIRQSAVFREATS